jgi:hypothetical protein
MGKFTEKLSQSTHSSGPKEEECNTTSRKKRQGRFGLVISIA